MNIQLQPHFTTSERHLFFECVALVLQGGGALGAYQGGVYEALAEANIHPDWIAGISIGAINAAIIAGNAPNSRVDRLREFWTQVTSTAPWIWSADPFQDLARGDDIRNVLNQISASWAMACGAASFFSARPVTPLLQPGGTLAATSFYDTKDLKHTLERLVDFDRLNAGLPASARARSMSGRAISSISTATPTRSGRSTSWRAERCRPAFPPSRSMASTTGMAA